MDRLRHLDPRRRASEQKMQQTNSVGLTKRSHPSSPIMFITSQTITIQNSPGNNGNTEQEPRQKVSSLVFKFGGDRNKKVPTYTFSPGKSTIIVIVSQKSHPYFERF